MWHKLIATSAALLSITVGCKTLHTGNEHDQKTPVAMWSDFLFVEKDGQKRPAPPELIASSLKKAGIPASVDEAGLHIAPEDEERAGRALLTDSNLKGTGILLFIPVEAGTGRETATSIEFSLPTTMSTTQPAK